MLFASGGSVLSISGREKTFHERRKGKTNMTTENRGKKNGNSRPDCRCGQCGTCIDNARWERIFKEKFADPLYYVRKQVRNASPIADM